jgi:Fe2+ transport system protein FeoA
MLLSEAPSDRRVRVTGFGRGGLMTTRLMEMGLIAGTEVHVVGYAPFGGTLQLRVMDYDLAVRRGEAALVEVALA